MEHTHSESCSLLRAQYTACKTAGMQRAWCQGMPCLCQLLWHGHERVLAILLRGGRACTQLVVNNDIRPLSRLTQLQTLSLAGISINNFGLNVVR